MSDNHALRAIMLPLALGGSIAMVAAPVAAADSVAYLVNVTVRPGYNFADADAALAYGYRICDRVRQDSAYVDTIAEIKRHFATDDDYQAVYLVNQAVNELCPSLIWQLRRSAVHYTGTAGQGG